MAVALWCVTLGALTGALALIGGIYGHATNLAIAVVGFTISAAGYLWLRRQVSE